MPYDGENALSLQHQNPLTKKIMQLSNLSVLRVQICLKRTFRRFPVTLVFTALFTIAAMTLVWHPDLLLPSRQFNLLAYLAEGTLLSLATTFWDEVEHRRHAMTTLLAHVFLFIIALLWMPCDLLGQEIITAHASIATCLLLLCVYLPFRLEKDDVVATNFIGSLFKAGVTCPLAGLIPTLALIALVTLSFPLFFHIDATMKDTLSIIIFFQVVFPMVLFLSRVARGRRMVDHGISVSTTVENVVKIILIPASVMYMCILYCYTAHIALAWELPNGGVSYLVAVMAAMVFALEFYLYFVTRIDNGYSSNWFLRWLPMLMMPLLVLMSIGIVRRISDYGLTAARLYLATANIWLYIVFIRMFITHVRRINWIPLSLAAVFLVTSFLPFNYNTIARLYIINDVKVRMAQTPYDDKEISQRQNYLRETYGYEVVEENFKTLPDSIQ